MKHDTNDTTPRILITGPHEELVRRLQAHLFQNGVAADTPFDCKGRGFGKAASFDLVVTMFESGGQDKNRGLRTLVISREPNGEPSIHVERNGLYASNNMQSLSQKIATLVSGINSEGSTQVGKGRRLPPGAEGKTGQAALDRIVGRCGKIIAIKARIEGLSRVPRVPVLISGETGTGKELVAAALHACSPRRQGPLVRVNCAAIPHNLFESQLFGHRKGAFSGALENQKGLVEEAIGGVLFLDEIGSLRLDLQPKLLRFLEDGSYLPIGETKERTSNAWVIAATNMDLEHLLSEGQFREDLYGRLKVWDINLPPLRHRQQDILLLARYFLRELSKDFGAPPKNLSLKVQESLMKYTWPRNVRELQNMMISLQLSTKATLILPKHLPPKFTDNGGTVIKDCRGLTTLKNVERDHISQVLQRTNFNIKKSARILGIDRNTLKRKIALHEISGVQSAP